MDIESTYPKKIVTIKKLLLWAKKYWFMYILISIIVLISSLIPVGSAEVFRRLIDTSFSRDFSQFWYVGFLFICVYLTEMILVFLKAYSTQILSNRSTLSFQSKIIDSLLNMKVSIYYESHSADKLQRINGSAIATQDGINKIIPQTAEQILSLIFLLSYLSYLSFDLITGSLIVALLAPMLSNLLGNRVHKYQNYTNESQANQDSQLQDQIQGAEVVLTYGLRERFNLHWAKKVERTRRYALITRFWQYSSGLAVFLGYWIGLIYIFIVGSWQISIGKLDIGTVAAFVMSYERIIYPMANLSNIWVKIQNILSHAGRVFGLTESQDIETNLKENSAIPMSGNLVFKGVTFSYGDGRNVIENFSEIFREGCSIALVGPSGGGKSTLLKLILGIYELIDGEILYGGVSLKNFNVEDWRKNIAYISQDILLFDTSAIENIRIARLDSSDEEVYRAAKLANAHEFLTSLPNGYFTHIGDRGVKLSGGERQRLALARAFLRNPKILLLDEPTSALDRVNEDIMKETLRRKLDGRTVIVVAHRLSTVRESDIILYIENGRIVEKGNHYELIGMNGKYATLIRNGEWVDQEGAYE